jgi:hypothetical protein
VQSQELFRSNKWLSQTIRTKSLDKNSYGYQAFSYMAINQGKHIDQVFIDWQSNLLTTVVRTNVEQVTVFVKVFNSKANGFVKFHDFTIDTLLLPSVLNGTVDLYSGANKVASAPVSTLYNGGYISFELQESAEKVRAEFKLSELEYTLEDFEKLIWWGTLLNYYYSYHQILEQTVSKVQNENIGRNNNPSEVFLTWHILNRVNNYVEHHDFYNKLHLGISDPKGLNEFYKKSLRLERRYLTLSEQLLDSEKKGSISDKHTFCEDFAFLSKTYLNQSEVYQPSMALGYYEMLKIFPDSLEMKMIDKESRFYDVFNKLGDGSTFQMIYDHYIELANFTFAAGKDVATLDILRNASLFSNYFQQVQDSPQYKFLFTETLETLLGSYLKVAIMSYKAGNFDMAEDYSAKAIEIFNNSNVEIADIQLSPGAFANYNRQQIDLVNNFLKDKKYKQSIKLLNNASTIIKLSNNQIEKGRLDSAFTIAHTGIYNNMLDSIAMLPEMKNTDDKLKVLEFSQKYAEKHSPYVITDNAAAFKLANSLFIEFYRKGEDLLVEEKADEALKNLLKAKYINESYFHSTDAELDTLIYNATVPVILDLIKQAEFETWANRMDKAKELRNRAKNMQITYKQENQSELVEAFVQLSTKMNNRACVSNQQNINSKAQIIQNRIASGKIDDAIQEFKKIDLLIQDSKTCNLNRSGLDEIIQKNEDLFYYKNKKNELEIMYFANQYEELISQYILLSEFYNQKNLSRYKFENPSLYSYIENKSNPQLTVIAANYFSENSEYSVAFTFLQLLKKQHVLAKTTKELQEKIGAGLGKDKKNGLATLDAEGITKGDDWYKYFRTAYSGGLMGKLLFLTGHN